MGAKYLCLFAYLEILRFRAKPKYDNFFIDCHDSSLFDKSLESRNDDSIKFSNYDNTKSSNAKSSNDYSAKYRNANSRNHGTTKPQRKQITNTAKSQRNHKIPITTRLNFYTKNFPSLILLPLRFSPLRLPQIKTLPFKTFTIKTAL
ncbi:hypothetical protein [Helicobacter sp. T3_23-1056]